MPPVTAAVFPPPPGTNIREGRGPRVSSGYWFFIHAAYDLVPNPVVTVRDHIRHRANVDAICIASTGLERIIRPMTAADQSWSYTSLARCAHADKANWLRSFQVPLPFKSSRRRAYRGYAISRGRIHGFQIQNRRSLPDPPIARRSENKRCIVVTDR